MEVKGIFVINKEAYSCNVTPPLCMNALPCLHTHTEEKKEKKTGVWRRTDECLPSEHRATVVVVAVEESDSSHTGG